jgi:Zn-dependent protease with chaperone function
VLASESSLPGNDDAAHLPQWTSAEREHFFNAIARHRRAAWQVAIVSHGANFIVALIAALLMSPLFYAMVGLALDLLNLLMPTADLMDLIRQLFAPMLEGTTGVPPFFALSFVALAAAPGLAWMALVITGLRRVLQLAATHDGAEIIAREPNRTLLAEQRLVNVIAEMAIAARLPPPHVMIVDAPIRNAAVFGRDEAHALILVSSELLKNLNRSEMQGVAAHLIASVANGDMRVGLQTATTLSLFAVMGRLSKVLTDGSAWTSLMRMALALLRPTQASARKLVAELTDPFAPEHSKSSEPRSTQSSRNQLWHIIFWLPLAGPVMLTGLLVSLIAMFGLGPLMAVAWRRRKYKADATAVQLTRDPNTLAGALEKMKEARSFATWATHLSVIGARPSSTGLMSGSILPMSPGLSARLRALAKLGATLRSKPQPLPWLFLLIMAPLYGLAGALVGVLCFALATIAIPITTMFTGIPFAILHRLLRWLASVV